MALSPLPSQELERWVQNPPEQLAPAAQMMRHLKINHDKAIQDLAMAELELRDIKQRVKQLTATAKTIQDQRTVLTEAWRELVYVHRKAEAHQAATPAP